MTFDYQPNWFLLKIYRSVGIDVSGVSPSGVVTLIRGVRGISFSSMIHARGRVSSRFGTHRKVECVRSRAICTHVAFGVQRGCLVELDPQAVD